MRGLLNNTNLNHSLNCYFDVEAVGQGPEHNLPEPLVEQVKENSGEDYTQDSALTADAGFHNKNNIAYGNEEKIDAYIADGNFRKCTMVNFLYGA